MLPHIPQRFLGMQLLLVQCLVLESISPLPKLVLYFSHSLISSKFEAAADEIMVELLQHQYPEVNMDCKTRNSSVGYLRIPVDTGPAGGVQARHK